MKQLVDFTSAVFDALGYLNKFHGLVKTVNRSVDGEVKKYPAKIGFEEVPIDFEPKMAYMRLGQVTTTPLDEDACSRRVTKSFPFTLVVGLPEDILSTPNEYIALKVAQNISNSLQSTQTNSLRTAIKADDVEVNISDIQTDPYTVWTNERNDHYEYPTDRLLISMEVTFVIQGHVACFAILGCDDVETELVQQYTDSDRVVKDFPFGGHPVCIPAGECADGSITNSDATYNATVASGGVLVLSDIEFTDSDGSVSSVPAQTDIVATPCSPTYPWAPMMKTGQTVSYRAGDDGDDERGRTVSFTVLSENNPFGNTNRFTDEFGGQTYTLNIVIDWSTFSGTTVLGLRRTTLAGATWDNQIDACVALTVGTFASGWRLINDHEMFNWMNRGLNDPSPLNYAPLNISTAGNYWTGTTSPTNSALKYFMNTGSGGTISVTGTGTVAIGIAVRVFTWNGVALT